MKNLIKKILHVAYVCKEGHIASSLSVLDILWHLYSRVVNRKKIVLGIEDRDRVVLSKGHASLALYAVLDHFGMLDDDIYNFGKSLSCHSCDKNKYVETSTGSLGHGLPMAVGMAMAYKILGYKRNIFCIIGDGEANEGTTWECFLLAAQHKLENLWVIMDYNKSNDKSICIESVGQSLMKMGWSLYQIDGHDPDQLDVINPVQLGQPCFMIAETIKGNGIKSMEHNPAWHHRTPTKEEYEQFLTEIDNDRL